MSVVGSLSIKITFCYLPRRRTDLISRYRLLVYAGQRGTSILLYS